MKERVPPVKIQSQAEKESDAPGKLDTEALGASTDFPAGT